MQTPDLSGKLFQAKNATRLKQILAVEQHESLIALPGARCACPLVQQQNALMKWRQNCAGICTTFLGNQSFSDIYVMLIFLNGYFPK